MARRGKLVEYEHLIGGLAGGFTSTIVCHPMDLLKIRYSANEGDPRRPQYSSYWDATKRIVRSGGFRSLYQGLIPNTVGATLSWGLYFHTYHWIKERFWPNPKAPTTNIENFLIGFFAGSFVMCLTNPIWVVKTRLCLQYETEARKYRGTVDCLRKVYTQEGVSGLYRGFVPGLFGNAHGALQFALYNYFKDRRCKALGMPSDAKLTTFDYLTYSVWSKVLATTLTYPYQVLRTRMQDHHVAKRSVVETMLTTIRGEGVLGLYKGLFMANIRQLPSAIVTFLTYENVKHFIRGL